MYIYNFFFKYFFPLPPTARHAASAVNFDSIQRGLVVTNQTSPLTVLVFALFSTQLSISIPPLIADESIGAFLVSLSFTKALGVVNISSFLPLLHALSKYLQCTPLKHSDIS